MHAKDSRVPRVLFWMTLAFVLVFIARASSGKVRLEASVDRKEVPKNEKIIFTVEVSWSGDLEDYEFQWPSSPDCEKLEVVGNSSSNEIVFDQGEKVAVKQFTYILQPFAQGEWSVGPVSLTYTSKSTGESHTLRTKAIPVTITEALPEDKDAFFVYLLIGICAIVSICAAGFAFRRKRKRSPSEEKAVPDKSAEEESLEQLDQTSRLRLSGEFKDYYDIISRILKGYVERKWGIECAKASTSDIVSRVKKSEDIPREAAEKIEDILSACDIVKFAGHDPEPEELDRIYDLAQKFLRFQKL